MKKLLLTELMVLRAGEEGSLAREQACRAGPLCSVGPIWSRACRRWVRQHVPHRSPLPACLHRP
jgi:hypothetical protein